jgi:hypothetical protein
MIVHAGYDLAAIAIIDLDGEEAVARLVFHQPACACSPTRVLRFS